MSYLPSPVSPLAGSVSHTAVKHKHFSNTNLICCFPWKTSAQEKFITRSHALWEPHPLSLFLSYFHLALSTPFSLTSCSFPSSLYITRPSRHPGLAGAGRFQHSILCHLVTSRPSPGQFPVRTVFSSLCFIFGNHCTLAPKMRNSKKGENPVVSQSLMLWDFFHSSPEPKEIS